MKLYKINNMCYCVAIDESFTCAFGSPPEWIKQVKEFSFPWYIFLVDTLFSKGMNFCEIEFPVYKNFFFNKQRKTHVVAPKPIIDDLKYVLEEAIFGPSQYEDEESSKRAAYYTDYLALREGFSLSGRKLFLPDFITFESYDRDEYKLGLVTIQKVGPNSFIISKGRENISIKLKEFHPTLSSLSEKIVPKNKGKIILYCFDSGDGFSPNKECSSFMLKIEDSFLLFDPNFSSFDTYCKFDAEISKLKGIIVSHIHADHEQGLYRFLHKSPNTPIYAAGEVANSLKKKIEILLKIDSNTLNLKKLPIGKNSKIEGLNIEVFCEYGFHSIPSAMMKFRFLDIDNSHYLIGYSGDTLYDPVRFREERFPSEYRELLEHFFDDVKIIIHEAGAGLIHTDPEDLIPFLRDDQKIFWLHTPRTNENSFSKGWILQKGAEIVIV